MNAKTYLYQVKKLDKLIENKIIEMDKWKAIATGTTASSEGDRVQSSIKSQDKMADAVIKYIEIESELNDCIDELINKKQEIIATIEQLPATEYDVLHKIYVQHKTLDDVADDYDKTYSWITTVHGKALKSLRDIITEKEQAELHETIITE